MGSSDQRVISTLTGTGTINPRMPNGVPMLHTVSTTLVICQPRQPLDPTLQNKQLSSNLISKRKRSGLNFQTAPVLMEKSSSMPNSRMPPKLPAKPDQLCEYK